jgi:N-methylhydantoinase B
VLKGTEIPLSAGDVVTFLTAGGGGYGDPKERAPDAVKRDVAEGLVSAEAALTHSSAATKEPASR